ncbi:hypothetical protein HH214_14405 [Mucilaginibacter robiniae]|uniref:Galactose oxidase n=1 Tax=Mucilaginibacter robiniae TaxID=2728022 RepID=A0A7L5E5D9_9SPHI|nr:kelch repeat-containing protein [Mucilaginibacter robiniae]QJD96974.1 hypothetical protein HH214_14405 [Mucilaginibacter robiniae]
MKIKVQLMFGLAVAMLLQNKLYAQTNAPQPANLLNFVDYAPLPQRVNYSAYANDGQHLYSLNGQFYNKRISSEAYRYNPDANRWDKLTDKLIPKIKSSAVYIPSVHKIYIMGGLKAGGTGLFYDVETLDTQTGEVNELHVSNPLPELNGGLAVWNDKIYVFGGSERNYGTSKLYEFDIHMQKFTRLKDMPHTGEISGTIVNGKLYTFGGFEPFRYYLYKDVNAYNIQSNTWQQVGKLPENVSATSLAQLGKYIFVNGNYSNPGFSGYYDVETNQFTKINSNLIGRRFASSGVIGNKLYIYGGNVTPIDAGQVSLQGADIQPVVSAKK